MRAIICTDYCAQLRKLIWVTENRTGVSAGICDRANPHATYHIDGTYHHKIKQRGSEITVSSEKKEPLTAITSKVHLLGTAAFYVDGTMSRLPPFTPDERADSMVILGQSVFTNIRCAAFHSFILHRNHETAFLSESYADYENESFILVAVHMFGLELFSDHKVGMIVYKGRGSFPFPGQANVDQAADHEHRHPA